MKWPRRRSSTGLTRPQVRVGSAVHLGSRRIAVGHRSGLRPSLSRMTLAGHWCLVAGSTSALPPARSNGPEGIGRLSAMVKPAREKIALLLRGGESTGSFSAETSAPVAGLTLSVDGVGPVKLPAGAPQERAMVSVARPAFAPPTLDGWHPPGLAGPGVLPANGVDVAPRAEQRGVELDLRLRRGAGRPPAQAPCRTTPPACHGPEQPRHR